ncbi:MAG: YdeI/OmpD-associated family protein [Ignavibacteriae bacterium]|nr:YdeI/OmpD-associated family protein [Ignavibacteriota bacterium]
MEPITRANSVHLTTRKAWRSWLSKHFKSEKEVWLIFYKQHTGRPRISYNDAVEEALCFGWIDSKAKSLDKDRFAQRFSPRRPKRPYSQPNKERLRKLIAAKKVRREVLATLPEGALGTLRAPSDIVDEMKKNPVAWRNFRAFSAAYKRIRIGFVDGARKRPAEFKKRLRYLVKMSEKNKQFGFGGIAKHY